jgi:archaemetzincin
VSERGDDRSLTGPDCVVVVAVGDVEPKLVQAAGATLHGALRVPARTAPPLYTPEYAFNKERNQYHATSIVRRLASCRQKGRPIVGILGVDLFVPDAPYVIGDADRDAGAAVFSVARFSSPDPEVVRRRAGIETIHAAGHLLGLSLCSDSRCAMFGSRDAADTDRKSGGICANCRSALGLSNR